MPPQKKKSQKKSGGAGYRSRYLPHAKRALYHLSYAPTQTRWRSADLALQKGDESTAAGPRKPGGGPGGEFEIFDYLVCCRNTILLTNQS